MIGFVNVDINRILRAYEILNSEEDIAEKVSKSSGLKERISYMSNTINNSAGNNSLFSRKNDKVKLKSMLQEVAYASYASSSDSMIIRIEMASIILDIIKIHDGVDCAFRDQQPEDNGDVEKK